MTLTFDQVRGPLERLVLIALGWLVAKGYITTSEVADYATLILAILAAFYGWWQNRPKAILQAASDVPGVKKIISANPEQVLDPSLPKVQGS